MKEKTKGIYEDFLTIIKKPEMKVLPGGLAFYFLMSFIPIIALCFLIATYISNSLNYTEMIYNAIPSKLADIVSELITSASSYNNFSILFVCYLLAAMNGPYSIIVSANTLYKIEDYSIIKSKIKSLFMTIFIVVLIIFMIFIPVLGDIIIKLVFENLFNIDFFSRYIVIYKIIKMLISFIFIYLFIKILYIMAPNKKIKYNTVTYGALFTTTTWIIATEVFAFYIVNIAEFDALYGNFASILILLMWLYILAYLFVMGLAINIEKYMKDLKK